jgi:hypothetical protein
MRLLGSENGESALSEVGTAGDLLAFEQPIFPACDASRNREDQRSLARELPLLMVAIFNNRA